MNGQQTFLLRTLVGLLCGLASFLAWTLAPRIRLAPIPFERLLVAAFAVSRLALFTLVFLVLHIPPRGDITHYLFEAAQAPGHLIYRDFPTNHAPLSPYLLSALLHLHHSPLTLILFAILCDVAALVLWMRAAPHFLDQRTLRRAALLVLFNPTSLLAVAIDGQTNALVALLLALAVWALVTRPTSRRASILSGTAVALSAATVRFTTLIYAPGFLFASRRKLPALLGFFTLLLALYGGFALAGADITTPLRLEGPHKTSSNLIFLLELITGDDLGLRLPITLLGLSWIAVVAVVYLAMRAASAPTEDGRRRTAYILTLSLLAELLCIQIFSKNAWDRYLVMTLFPLCVLAAELSRPALAAFTLWTIAAVTEPSLWASITHSQPALELHVQLLARDPATLTLLVVETLYVAGSIALLTATVRRILTIPRPSAN